MSESSPIVVDEELLNQMERQAVELRTRKEELVAELPPAYGAPLNALLGVVLGVMLGYVVGSAGAKYAVLLAIAWAFATGGIAH